MLPWKSLIVSLQAHGSLAGQNGWSGSEIAGLSASATGQADMQMPWSVSKRLSAAASARLTSEYQRYLRSAILQSPMSSPQLQPLQSACEFRAAPSQDSNRFVQGGSHTTRGWGGLRVPYPGRR